VHVERLTSESYEEDDLAGIPDLIEVIKLQATGPTEAARALRKKLKYGSVHRQLRALTILDGLIQNAGSRFQRSIFSDEPLLERLRIAASDSVSDPEVRTKCKVLFGQWAAGYKAEPGLEGAAALYKQLPKTRKPQVDRREQSKVLRETEEQARRDEATEDDQPRRLSVGPSTPRTSANPTSSGPALLTPGPNLVTKTKKSKKNTKTKLFHLEREKPALLQTLASSQVASTNLTNALKLVNRESHRVSDDPEVMKRFETCKQLRRQILRYIQYVESDDFLGGLIHANEELVTALMAFEVLDKSVDDDSDSEMEEAAHLSRAAAAAERSASVSSPSSPAPPHPPPFTEGMVGLSLQSPKMPPRPRVGMLKSSPQIPLGNGNGKVRGMGRDSGSESEEREEDDDNDDDDEDNPFGDRNATATPRMEKQAYTWREV
jgi:LAS seventeen-binding protein 5